MRVKMKDKETTTKRNFLRGRVKESVDGEVGVRWFQGIWSALANKGCRVDWRWAG